MSEPVGPITQAEEEASDALLMAQVRAGDRQAFAELVDRHKDAVVSYLTRITGSRDRAEDLGQETFLRLFRAASTYSEQGYLRAFLFRIATNLVRSEERRERRLRLLLPLLRSAEAVPPAAAAGLLRQEIHREVAAAIAKVPLRYRVPLVLHEIEGWSYADIAAELDCREGTVKSRIHRGRQQLKQRLEPYWIGGLPWKTTS
jgi:RNA polymerase sigma-70 factor (ECF subfamily)